MKILYIGKYPPILSGEGNKAYWLLDALAKKGHKIKVLTNSMEVEEQYRAKLTPEDSERMVSENLSVVSTNKGIPHRFIPQTNPFLEKLISLGLEEVESFNPDILYSWYLVPYGVAGHSISQFTGTPHITQHAGSDISFLYEHPSLHTILKEVLIKSEGVITYKRSEEFIRNIGANPLVHTPSFSDEFEPFGDKTNLSKLVGSENLRSEDSILFLGKITKSKGLNYLISAMKNTKQDINLVVVGDGPSRNLNEEIVRKNDLEGRVHFLGALPPWKIPPLIRSVKSVIIPEYNFGVPIHQSGIPYESMLCGVNPIVSEQLRGKYKDPTGRIRFINPTNEKEFAEVIEEVIDTKSDNVEKYYNRLREAIGHHSSYVEQIENYLLKLRTS
ncbi:MAG: glycosyltransferase family 4 protein [Nanoarchaeota archaeon]|nr:glycosyltransferase family 4 protein [Nanoarchaeota archaeon]